MMKIYREKEVTLNTGRVIFNGTALAIIAYGLAGKEPDMLEYGKSLLITSALYTFGALARNADFQEITPPEGQEVVIENFDSKEPTFYLEPKATP